jgi:hypothetical protein
MYIYIQISPESHGDFFWVFVSRTFYYMAVSCQIYIMCAIIYIYIYIYIYIFEHLLLHGRLLPDLYHVRRYTHTHYICIHTRTFYCMAVPCQSYIMCAMCVCVCVCVFVCAHLLLHGRPLRDLYHVRNVCVCVCVCVFVFVCHLLLHGRPLPDIMCLVPLMVYVVDVRSFSALILRLVLRCVFVYKRVVEFYVVDVYSVPLSSPIPLPLPLLLSLSQVLFARHYEVRRGQEREKEGGEREREEGREGGGREGGREEGGREGGRVGGRKGGDTTMRFWEKKGSSVHYDLLNYI